MLSRLIKRQAELPRVYSIFLEKPRGFVFEAGDYTELELEYPPNGGRRWFSLSSAPSEDDLRITFKLPHPHSGFKKRLMELKAGQEVQLAPPMGNFNLPLKPRPVLFVAIGIGATPFRSIVEELAIKKRLEDWDIKMVHAAKDDGFLFEDTFGLLDRGWIKTPTLPRLTPSKLFQLVPDLDSRIVFFAGPEAVTAALHGQLGETMGPSRLRLSYFPSYKDSDA